MSTMETVGYDAPLLHIFKGGPGTRKSTSALSYAQNGPMYFFDFEQKMRALLQPMKLWNIDPKIVHFDYYNEWSEAKRKLDLFIGHCPYNTIVLDSLTSWGDTVLLRSKVKKGSSDDPSKGHKYIGDIEVNTVEDFNAESAAAVEMIDKCKLITTNGKTSVILIAHVIQTEQKDLKGEISVTRSLLSGGKKVAAKLPAYFEEVYHFNTKPDPTPDRPVHYEIITQQTFDEFARTTLPLPLAMRFDDKPLYSLIRKELINKGVISDVIKTEDNVKV